MVKGKSNDKIVLTGGHAATTALATIEELLRRGKNWQIYWLGVKKAVEGSPIPTLESQVLPKAGVFFQPIITGRLQRRFTIWTIPSLLKIPFGFFHAIYLLFKIRPNIILSFGGFAALPVVTAGRLLNIPVILHEQTVAVGLTNKVSSYFAVKVLVARKESLKFFPQERTALVGNPLMTQILEVLPKEKLADPPTIFVTGGSRGSLSINRLVEAALEEWLKKYVVIHQTGYFDFERFEKIKKKLSKDLSDNYEVYPVIDPMQIDGVYKRADLIIARAGANTVSEIIAVKRPAILIPIPWSYQDEQRKNAEFAREFGIAEIFDQEKEDESDLKKKVQKMFKNWDNYVDEVKEKESPDKKASQKLVDFVENYVE